MWLTTEELGEVADVTAGDIRWVLAADSFGKYAILCASENSFIQAGCEWDASPEVAAFLREHDSDPWCLEYHDGASNKHYRANRQVTLREVEEAFVSYLAGGDWRSRFHWGEVAL